MHLQAPLDLPGATADRLGQHWSGYWHQRHSGHAAAQEAQQQTQPRPVQQQQQQHVNALVQQGLRLLQSRLCELAPEQQSEHHHSCGHSAAKSAARSCWMPTGCPPGVPPLCQCCPQQVSCPSWRQHMSSGTVRQPGSGRWAECAAQWLQDGWLPGHAGAFAAATGASGTARPAEPGSTALNITPSPAHRAGGGAHHWRLDMVQPPPSPGVILGPVV